MKERETEAKIIADKQWYEAKAAADQQWRVAMFNADWQWDQTITESRKVRLLR